MKSTMISVEPSIRDLALRLRISNGIIYEPGRAHGKDRSTDLYVSDEWRVQDESITIKELINPNPENRVTMFTVPDELLSMLREVTNSDDKLVGGKVVEISDSIRDSVDRLVKARFGAETHYRSDSRMVVLRSNPQLGIQTGQTTNGLHFDNEESFSIRMGINVGDVARYVYYVPFERVALLPGITLSESQLRYEELSQKKLYSLSILIKPGEGWTLPTTEFLHDGRRAERSGMSTLALFRLVTEAR